MHTVTQFASSDEKWHLLVKRKNEQQVAESFDHLRKHNIEPVLIKGFAIAIKYPSDHPRIYSDIDLAVSKSAYSKALRLIQSDEQLSKLNIDLHCELRHLDTVEFNSVFERSSTISLNNTNIRVLAEEDHLRVLIAHWLNDGGESRDRLYDIRYAIENRSDSFDWDLCFDQLTPHRRKWIEYTISIAHIYLDLSIKDLPFKIDPKKLPTWLTKRVEMEWKHGTRLIPLQAAIFDRNTIAGQLLKRIAPNPIQSIIEMDGDLDTHFRFLYQGANLVKRTFRSISKIFLKDE